MSATNDPTPQDSPTVGDAESVEATPTAAPEEGVVPSRVPTWFRGLLAVLAVVALVALAFAVGRSSAPESAPESAATDAVAESEPAAEAPSEYVCPMHPQIRQDEPGTCPICHMDLVAVESADSGDAVTLSLSEHAAALARVRTAPVERVPLLDALRVFGRVGTDEDNEANITAWTAGRIDRLYVPVVGETVRRGQRIARVYSPELVVAQETLIHAQHILHATAGGSDARAQAARATVDAARTELRLLGVSDTQIDELVADGVADEYVHIYAPASGTVLRRLVAEGDHVQRGTPLVELADLDDVWVQLEIYERDLGRVTVGDSVTLDVAGRDAPIEGTIAFLDPVVDAQRRVARARVVVPNPDGALRPSTFVRATVHIERLDERGRPPVSVPANAVLWTGPRSLVYVFDQTVSPPVYMPVEVTIGDRVGDRIIVTEGVFPGETVVANGAFRLDAALQIRGGESMMGGGHDH